MRRFSVVSFLAVFLTAIFLVLLAGCGGGSNSANTTVAAIVLTPTTLSLNEGAVGTLSAGAQNSTGNIVAADITFTSSNGNIATVSSGGLVCAGVWDANIINCNPTLGQGGVGQVTITATSGKATATATVYVHLKVDRVVTNPVTGCISAGQAVTLTATVYSTSPPGCSQNAPCDITSTVGPISSGSNDLTVAANSSGIDPTYSSATKTPTYSSGGTITGSKGQTCNLSNFGVGGSSGIEPDYSPVTNSPTYTSGGTIIGSQGQTCELSDFNGVTGATATVTLTGTNLIVSGAHLIITSEGSGASTPPTTATLSNGTASCSGTANVITALTGVSGIGQSVVGAMANVALTGTNTIASGTALNVTASGYGATTPPTSAVLSNGTATCSGIATVNTALSGTGIFTAQNPGSTTIFTSVSGVNSVGVPYLTCPAVSILVHDATSSNTSFSLSKGGTQMLTADVLDSAGQSIKPALTWGSSSTASATVVTGTTGNNPATITAVAPGTASITAACSPPNCNSSLPNAPPGYTVYPQYSQNVVTASVSGTTATMVYAASTNSTTLVPISTATNATGTAVTLPNLPNSALMDPAGSSLYLGSSSGLMQVNLLTNVVTAYPVNGTVVAISPDSQYLLISDSVANNIYYLDTTTQTVLTTSAGFTTSSSLYTPDSKFNEWVSGTTLTSGFQIGVALGSPGNGMTTLPYTANALGIIAQGGLTYITGSNPDEVDIRSTCNQSEVQTCSANAPNLIGAIPNGTGAVAADSPSVDLISLNSNPPATLSPGCPIITQSTLTSFDMGVGPFNARQLFFSSDSSRAWIISDLPELIYFNLLSSTPVVIPYEGGATGYSGGITLDGSEVYIGASDGSVHRIDVTSGADVQQLGVSLKDANGNLVIPDLVTVQPH
jgi:hypothetical protein